MPPPPTQLKLPRGALKKLTLGQSFAEYDKLLDRENIYVETPALRAIVFVSKYRPMFITNLLRPWYAVSNEPFSTKYCATGFEGDTSLSEAIRHLR
jgi:hypothetical protein